MLNWLRKTFTSTRLDDPLEDHPSVVVLLKELQIRTSEESLNLVRRALGADTDVELIAALNNGDSHVLRDGKFFFTFHQALQRYELPGHNPLELQRDAWEQHKAWIAFDMPH